MAYIPKEQRSSRYTLSYYYGVKSSELTKGLSEKTCTCFARFGYISETTCTRFSVFGYISETTCTRLGVFGYISECGAWRIEYIKAD